MARIIALANQKGGVAKTSSTINLGAALVELGRRVLLVDLDQQMSLTAALGINPASLSGSICDVLRHTMPMSDIIVPAGDLQVAPATPELADVEIELLSAARREHVLAAGAASSHATQQPRTVDEHIPPHEEHVPQQNGEHGTSPANQPAHQPPAISDDAPPAPARDRDDATHVEHARTHVACGAIQQTGALAEPSSATGTGRLATLSADFAAPAGFVESAGSSNTVAVSGCYQRHCQIAVAEKLPTSRPVEAASWCIKISKLGTPLHKITILARIVASQAMHAKEPQMSNVNVNLTPYLKQYVESKLGSGRYNNVSEVVREALRLMEERDQLRTAQLRDLRAAIDEGEHSGDAIPLDMERIIAEARQERTARQTLAQT